VASAAQDIEQQTGKTRKTERAADLYGLRAGSPRPQGVVGDGSYSETKRGSCLSGYYRAKTAEIIRELCRLIGFRNVVVKVTKARAILGRAPALGRIERRLAPLVEMTAGNLIVDVLK